eukprot:TRINITY_DN8518_c0_g2_i1.p1 TRINITY_DN8518_c0_g2~~TRINITY_DN8518_c0_g2_i1.p1  ORF type:complete len:183 (-),score=30.60 TRINITY_DN8518_c0_g2_i1:153-701(-)
MAKKLTRVIHFANLPLALITPKSRVNIRQFALRTVPSASKVEIRNVLQAVYGLQVHKVCTINMEGKLKYCKPMKHHYRRPDYKKAYVVLKEPVTLPGNLYPFAARTEEIRAIDDKLEAKHLARVEAGKAEAERAKERKGKPAKTERKIDASKSRGREPDAKAAAGANSRSQYPKFAVPKSVV